jgi:phosphate transport system permease protein
VSGGSPHAVGREALRSDGLRRRKAVNRAMEVLATTAAFGAVAVLCVMVVSIARRGASALSIDFFTKIPMPFSFTDEPTGIANAIVGTILLVLVATAMALPIGVLTAIYVNEFAPRRIGDAVGLVLDVLNGIPAIVIGIFVFALIVVGHGQSGLAGSFALAIIMLPLVSRATIEVLALVPGSTREASLALGVPRWRTVLSVVLPQTIGGILTGTTLAIARVAGETAPLLFTSSLAGTSVEQDVRQPLQSIPVTIFEYSESPDPKDHAQAWAAALVLMAFVLAASLSAKALAARSRRRMGLTR